MIVHQLAADSLNEALEIAWARQDDQGFGFLLGMRRPRMCSQTNQGRWGPGTFQAFGSRDSRVETGAVPLGALQLLQGHQVARCSAGGHAAGGLRRNSMVQHARWCVQLSSSPGSTQALLLDLCHRHGPPGFRQAGVKAHRALQRGGRRRQPRLAAHQAGSGTTGRTGWLIQPLETGNPAAGLAGVARSQATSAARQRQHRDDFSAGLIQVLRPRPRFI